jgi:hypothetical protein
MLRKRTWRGLSLALLSGLLLQSFGCTPETALALSTIANLVTAGGVTYLVVRVLD